MQPIDLNLRYVESVFSLEIANASQTLVRIWSTRFSLGYDSIYFLVHALNGNSCLIRRKPTIWTVNVPDFVSMQPLQIHVEKFELNDGTWELSDCSIDLHAAIDIGAVVDIASNGDTDTYGIMTGHFESNKLQFRSLSEIIN